MIRSRDFLYQSANGAVLGLLALGAVSSGLWVVTWRVVSSDPIAEIPMLVAVTCFLGATSLYATTVVTAVTRARLDGSTSAVVSTIKTTGIAAIVLLLVGSFLAISNGTVYFALERQWPISPNQAGSYLFFFFLGLVAIPVLIGLVAGALLSLDRVRGST